MTKRKIKKILCIFAAAAMMLCLCSCMTMENGLILNADGSVRLFCSTTVEEEMLTSMDMTKEDFINNIKDSESSESYDGFEVEAIETTVDGKSHVGCRYYKDMTRDELNSYVQGEESVKSTYMVVEEGNKLIVKITYKNSNPAETNEMSEYIAQGMMTTSQSVTAPYEVIETNGTYDAASGTVTWDTLEVFTGKTPTAEYTVTYKLGSSFPVGIVFAIAGVLLVAVVVVVIVMKNNRQPVIPQAAVDFSTSAETTAAQWTPPVQTETTAAAPVKEAETVTEKAKVCEICGAPVGEEDQFCQVCGAKL